jgi:hypothetical protein
MDIPLYIRNLKYNNFQLIILGIFSQHYKLSWNVHLKCLVAEKNVHYRMWRWVFLENPIQPTPTVAYFMFNSQWNAHVVCFLTVQ